MPKLETANMSDPRSIHSHGDFLNNMSRHPAMKGVKPFGADTPKNSDAGKTMSENQTINMQELTSGSSNLNFRVSCPAAALNLIPTKKHILVYVHARASSSIVKAIYRIRARVL